MKKKLLTLLITLLMLSLVAIPATAKTDWTEIEGLMTRVGLLDEGREWFSKDGTKIFARDVQELYEVEANDNRLSGDLYYTFSGNLKFTGVPPVFFYGHFWGNIVIENEGGTWEGANTGVRTEEGYHYAFSVLHGHGDYEGLVAHIYFAREDTTDPYGPISFEGLIKEN